MGCAIVGVPHGGLSEGLRGLLGTLFSSVVLVADERSLLACLDGLHPELLLLDTALAPGHTFDLTARLRAADRNLRILLLVGGTEPALASAAEDAGADGCLFKGSLGGELMRAIETVRAGGTAFWSASPAEPGRPKAPPSSPSRREGDLER